MPHRFNPSPNLLKVGSKVTTDYEKGAENVIRSVTDIEQDHLFGSGYKVSADGGEPCGECGRFNAQPVQEIAGEWFVPVEHLGGKGETALIGSV